MNAQPPLKKLLADAKVGTDSSFKDFLSTHSHRDDLIAPVTLRKILTKFPVVRVEFGLAYAVEDDFPVVTNWMGELGVRGRVEVVQETLNNAMRDLGFKAGKPDPNAGDTLIFVRTQKGVTEETRFRGPHRWTGAKEASCGFQVYWKAQSRTKTVIPTLNTILETLPMLRDVRVDELVYTDLGDASVQALAVGGTWTKYYDWDITLAPKNASDMYQHLDQLLKDLGYAPGNVTGDLTMWERQKPISFAFLTRPDKKGLVHFRIQPES